ncbi:hypothetical protein [Zooshikella ganghwensis]|uniref:hypothetical protein n=1 Tax=Zooshikella ganghwensis TaxID=202772 RepID=UPI000418437E|nr:hypothetical protein [Zooshikella ganghwensis]
MEINTILGVLAGLGVGSLLNTLVSYITSQKSKQKDRRYEEKKTAYIGLLTALHDAAVAPSEANSKAYALWQTKCHIFGSGDVAKFAQRIADTNEGPRDARHEAYESLLRAIRQDLYNT